MGADQRITSGQQRGLQTGGLRPRTTGTNEICGIEGNESELGLDVRADATSLVNVHEQPNVGKRMTEQIAAVCSHPRFALNIPVLSPHLSKKMLSRYTARSLPLHGRWFSSSVARHSKVAVLGAGGGIGQPLSLLLKADPLVTSLSLYDIRGAPGVAADVSHIDTPGEVGNLPFNLLSSC